MCHGELQEQCHVISDVPVYSLSPARIEKIIVADPYRENAYFPNLTGVLDIGARISAIPVAVVDKLGLPAWGIIPVKVFGEPGRTVDYPVYSVQITIPGAQSVRIEALGCEREDVLLGRDVLRKLKTKLVFNAFSLRWGLSNPSAWDRVRGLIGSVRHEMGTSGKQP